MSDLWSEFSAATAAAQQRHFEWLERNGVPHEFLWRGPMRFGIAAIVPSNDGSYQPIEDGLSAIIMPVTPLLAPCEWEDGDDIEDVGDLIAWRPEEPGRWWWRTGMLPVINHGAIFGAEMYREPLRVWCSPLSWMRAAGDGVVILDPAAELRFWLGGVSQLLCETIDLGRDIERRLRGPEPKLPKILVPNIARAA